MTTAMDLQKINIKFFAKGTNGIRLEDFIPVFNSWIQAADGAYYDIADYSHVNSGPGIVLIAHEANVSIDCAGDRLGLLYNQKQPLPGTNQEKLRTVFRSALENCRRLEGEPALGGGLRFRGNDAALVINDRLLAPNTEESFEDVRPEIEFFARSLFRGENFVLDRDKDPRKRFNVSIRTPAFFDAQQLLKNLEIQVREEER